MSGASTEDFRKSFFEECEELLEAMHDGFDTLLDGPDSVETMNAIFRAVHSIKGGAGAFGLSQLVAFAHHFETALDRVRSGVREVDAALLDLFRRCGDTLSDLIVKARDQGDQPVQNAEDLRAQLDDMMGGDLCPQDEPAPDFEPIGLDLALGASAPDALMHYRIEFAPRPELFANGNEPQALFRALSRLGEVDVVADLETVPPLEHLGEESFFISWVIEVTTDASIETVRDVFEFVEEECRIEVDLIASDPSIEPALEQEPTNVDEAALPSLTDLIGTDASEPEPPASVAPPAAKDQVSEARKSGGTIRVDLERIDKLINLVGELVIKEAMLSQAIEEIAPTSESNVSVGLESLKQLAGEIQEGVMAIRAQPVKPMFQRMARIAREASAATEKPVRFETTGEYTEVDKTVIERLVDPLTHMIRNAIDHGVESVEDRVAAGKPPEGCVTLSAAHRSGRVVIEVSDDGGGINRETVRALAIERELISESDTLSPSEIDNLLFLPGFSSKDEVSELSGRGVGLDVVRSEIHTLGGRVSIQSSPGEGTRFSISLPLTLAVLEGMVIRVANQTMVVPISAIQETLQPAAVPLHVIGADGLVLENRNGLVPVVDLGEFFGFRATPDDMNSHVLLLIEADGHQRYALVVDEIQDQRQVVIKSLETNYQQVDGVAAATILGDGRIALIIDPDSIVKKIRPVGKVETTLQLAG